MTANVTRIDNADSRVVYEGAWIPEFNNDSAWNKTLTRTRGANNSASISFIGNSIVVYGVLGDTAPHSTRYNLDNLPPTSFNTSLPTGDAQSGSVLFYQSPPLPYGKHALTMTNTKEKNWISLDYFEVTSLSDGNSTGLLTPSATPTASSSANSKEASVALIVGASLGGLVIVLLLACLVRLLLRRRQKFTSEPILPQYGKATSSRLSHADSDTDSDATSLLSTVDEK
ncbi:hypothetical protein BJ165DRAFT_1448019 [Panaeolus papilionaceus]|nr:hypothetical protein BJ165DRAFT_1448019 [Panaeolus papilionaceus]